MYAKYPSMRRQIGHHAALCQLSAGAPSCLGKGGGKPQKIFFEKIAMPFEKKEDIFCHVIYLYEGSISISDLFNPFGFTSPNLSAKLSRAS